jgi:phosphopentomutase
MKAIILILDGVGVGLQDDPGDNEQPIANTLVNTARVTALKLPVLGRLGLGNIAVIQGVPPADSALASYGKSRLAYNGADSYLGHQEILGLVPPPARSAFLAATSEQVTAALAATGHRTTRAAPGHGALLIDEAIVVGDNLEAEAGTAINILVPTAATSFAHGAEIGRTVRQVVPNLRVIICGGAHFTTADAIQNLTVLATGQVGVPTPSLALYDETYQVQHLGLPVDSRRQLPHSFSQRNLPVALLGKVADLVTGPVTVRNSSADTNEVLGLVLTHARGWEHGLIVATIQETDLAGHQQDPSRMAHTLAAVDAALPRILGELSPSDIVVITADHGNDPTIASSAHTREHVPLLWYQQNQEARKLGVRSSLADPAATIARLFALPWTGQGRALPLQNSRSHLAGQLSRGRQVSCLNQR